MAETVPKDVDTTLQTEKIREQIEFYFSDSNYPRDKFLLQQASLNPQGFVPISVLVSFNRMKSLNATVENVAASIKASQVVVLSEDGKMLKRATPLPADDPTTPRSIYVKGLPKTLSIDDLPELKQFFGQYGGAVFSVRLRKMKEKTFKGSAFVEYASEEEAKKALEQKWVFRGTELTSVITKEAFLEEKKKEQQDHKRKREEVKAEEERKRKEEEERQREEDRKRLTVPGTVVKLEGVGEGVNKFDIKGVFEEFGEVGFVEYREQEQKGYVRFKAAIDAAKAVDKLVASKREIGGKVPTMSVLAGEEEQQYFDKILKAKEDKTAGGGKRGGPRRKKPRH